MIREVPRHLRKYIVEQDYSRYTPQDQAVWRYIMRQLRAFLSVHAHPCYLEGLAKTGIEVDRIPDIDHMSAKLEKFGWRALPVSGFIPPAAFMELQSLSFLPIASDMRSLGHIMYTPAPDIVHEAAGHAPILVEPAFAAYLKQYAQVAKRAIISHQDLAQYEAIRVLSDCKEDPDSTPEQIAAAERELETLSSSIQDISEAAILGRMNWWTAEYGMIGALDNPKIFGAGLLSSVGESRASLGPSVRKIPLSLDCINFAYDITEQQPQLFVAKDFAHLGEVLEQLAATMAFRRGGVESLAKIQKAATTNTVVLNSGLQISGVLQRFSVDAWGAPSYLQFQGPTQLCEAEQQLLGHGPAAHPHGFGSPVGLLQGQTRCLSQFSDEDLRRLGVALNHRLQIKFTSGVVVDGQVQGWIRGRNGQLLVLTFSDCTVTQGSTRLFEPAWGSYDMAVASAVPTVFGGPADREGYGDTSDFVAKIIPRRTYSPETQRRFEIFAQLRNLRERAARKEDITSDLHKMAFVLQSRRQEWLMQLELLEICEMLSESQVASDLRQHLERLASSHSDLRSGIQDGLRVLGMA